MPFLLYLEIGLSVLPLICVAIYYPDHPAQPPSASAAAARNPAVMAMQRSATLTSSFVDTIREFKIACGQGTFVLLALAGGLEMAIYGCWSGVLTVVMADHFGTSKVRRRRGEPIDTIWL